MNAPVPTPPSLAFSSREFLRLIEACGLTGSWRWTFADGGHAWSPGLFRLLGLEPGAVRPSYDLFLSLVHPEDRAEVASPTQVMGEGILRERTVRVVRPDGTLRALACRGEVYVDPEGRPRAAAGIMLDVTDGERLAEALRAERQRRRVLFEQCQTWMHTSAYTTSQRVGSGELLGLTGVTQEEYQADWALTLEPEDRGHMRPYMRAMIEAGQPFMVRTRFRLAEGGTGHFRGIFAPMRRADGEIACWSTLSSRAEGVRARPADALRQSLEQAVKGCHLRAARGLLDWSMQDLARASGLSLSTIRRLEEGGEGPAARSRHAAVAALRQAGIGFLFVDAATLAVAKVR